MSDFFIILKPSAVWTAENPSMPPNYLGVESLIVDGVETETNKAKLFNGIDAWNDLDYWSPGGTASGDVTGPASSTDNAIARFDLATGKLLQNSVVTIADSTGNIGGTVTFNKVTITPPATGSTLTIADGKTLTASNSITLAGTDATTMTFPPASASIGYLNIPQNAQTGAYGLVLADAGKHIYHASGAGAQAVTIPANGTIAFPIGTAITIVNDSATSITVVITTDVLHYANVGAITTATIPQFNQATIIKVLATQWNMSGTAGVTTA